MEAARGERERGNKRAVIYFASTAVDLLEKIIDPLNPWGFSSPHWPVPGFLILFL